MAKHKWFLYLTEFFSGMSVMAIELGASRLLAPYFSSSQIVWTIIIGAIMIAMALGNIWGGRMADKNSSPDRLYARLLVVAVWTAAVPFVGKYIIAGISICLAMLSGENFLIWASLISCLVLFVFPLMLLGTVSPSLARFSLSSIDESGKTVGELNALNTIGSIIGTFTPTFITIPAVGTAWTFIIFSGVLLLLSLIYFISERKKLIKSAVALLLVVVCAIFGTSGGFAFFSGGTDEMYEDESIYNYLQVLENDDRVTLSTNVMFGVQSVLEKNRSLTGMYYDYALAAPLMADAKNKDELKILILGFGTGTYAVQCRKYFPNSVIEGVEIDKKILDLAYSRFGLPEDDEKITAVEFDGRAYLRNAGKYDVIMVDAYRDITIPFQMSSLEFFGEVKEHLTDSGVMVVNLNMRSSSDAHDSINSYLCDTVSAVFDDVYTVDKNGNTEVFASCGGKMMSAFYENEKEFGHELRSLMISVENSITEYDAGNLVLTDDKAPVELLGMKVIDELISDEISYYRELFKGRSISEILELLF